MPESVRDTTIQEAEQRGRRQQVVDGALADHDRRLASHDQHFAELNGSVHRTEKKVDALSSQIREDHAVSQALAKAAKDAISKQLSRREFWLGVGAIVAALVGPHLGGI